MKLGVAHIFTDIALLAVMVACSPTTEQNAFTAGAYEADQLACVDHAASRAESQACRCEVKARYGRPCNLVTDAGVPVLVPADGGK